MHSQAGSTPKISARGASSPRITTPQRLAQQQQQPAASSRASTIFSPAVAVAGSQSLFQSAAAASPGFTLRGGGSSSILDKKGGPAFQPTAVGSAIRPGSPSAAGSRGGGGRGIGSRPVSPTAGGYRGTGASGDSRPASPSATSGSRVTGRGHDGFTVATAAALAAGVISIPKSFGWQERQTRHWLASMGLEVLPDEETAPFLDNPFRCVRVCACECVCN